jgi:hypothetical protein
MRPFSLTLLLLLICGCRAEGTVLPVVAWTLEADGRTTEVRLPKHLDVKPGTYRLRASVTLPPELRGRPLTLTITSFPALVTLRTPGSELRAAQLGPSAIYRTPGPLSWLLPASASETLDLELVAEHRWARSNWIDGVPRLSATPHGDRVFLWISLVNETAANFAAAGTWLIGLPYLFIFLLDRKRRSPGWFAIEAFSVMAYPTFLLGLTQPIFGTHDVSVMLVAISITCVASVHTAHAQYDLGRPSVWWDLSLIPVVLAALIWRDPFVALGRVGIAATAVLLAVGAYEGLLYRKLSRQKNPIARMMLIARTMQGLTVWTDLFFWFGLGALTGGLRLFPVALLVRGLIQSLALSREHTLKLREVESLNVELRRQIGERSRELADALQRVDGAPTPELRPGSDVDGRYRVLRRIGSGGMGSVYEVERATDQRRLALKVMHGNAAPGLVARFAREAQVLARLSHRNLVAILDVDIAKSGGIYLVMELVEGSTLEEQRERFGDLAWARPILRQIAAGLAAVHEQGVVHRDLKPSNVLLTVGGVVKIADFGVSSLGAALDATQASGPQAKANLAHVPTLAATPSGLTRTGAIVGTPMYMPPEFLKGARDAAPPSDVFSFGVLAYELACGRHPFGEPPASALAQGKAAPRFGDHCELPPELAALLDRCLATDARFRPAAMEIAAAV